MKKPTHGLSILTTAFFILIQLTACQDLQPALSDAKQITAFSFDRLSPAVTGVISQSEFSVSLTVPYGTPVDSLIPTVAITGKSIIPASGTARDFTHPLTYTVTAADSSKQAYVVTVNIAPSSTKEITAFSFAGLDPSVAGVISADGFTIHLEVPYGTAVEALIPTITFNGQGVSPASGVAQDFTNPVSYTVTAADGSMQAYGVTVTFLPSPATLAWTTNGPTEEYVRAFAVNGENIFAGTNGDGIFRSTNNGTSWTAVNSGLTNQNILTLTQSGGTIYAGTSAGIFSSTDNGTAWNSIGLPNEYVYSIAISGSTIFAGTYTNGIFQSTNNGESWTSSGLTGQYVASLAVSGSNIFAGTDGQGIYLSADNGASWSPASSGLTDGEVYSIAVSGSTIFAGTWNNGIYLSTDNGTTWTSSGLASQNVHSFAVTGDKIFAGVINSGVFLSTDNGANWTAVNVGLTSQTVISLAVGNGNIFAGTQGFGVFNSPL